MLKIKSLLHYSGKKGILVIVMVMLAGVGFGQAGNWVWARKGISPLFTSQFGYNVATDISGNVYAIGTSDSTIIFGQDTLAYLYGSFIVKYNSNGNVLWAKAVGGSTGLVGRSVTTDNSGNVYVTGQFGNLNFSFAGSTVYCTGSTDMFILKYDSNGNEIWARSSTGPGYETGYSVKTDYSGNVYVFGEFSYPTSGGLYISIHLGTFILTIPPLSGDMFLVKYDTNGNVLWAKCADGNATGNININVNGRSVATDLLGNVYITGAFYNPHEVFENDTIFNIGPPGFADIYIVKYNTNGNVMWAKRAGGSGADQGYSLATDAYNNIYLTGLFQNSNFVFANDTLNNIGSQDFFIAKYNSLGNEIWAKCGGGINQESGLSVATDVSGVFVSGSLTSSTFILGTDTLIRPLNNQNPLFLVKFDSIGNVLCRTLLSSGSPYPQGNAISTDFSGNLYLVGTFSGYSNFILGSDTLNLNPGGGQPYFIAKYNCNGTSVATSEIQNPKSEITLYPNPATNNLTIAFGKNIKKVVITITDITGKLICTSTTSETEKMEVNTSGFAEGVYIVKIQTGDGVEMKKLIVER